MTGPLSCLLLALREAQTSASSRATILDCKLKGISICESIRLLHQSWSDVGRDFRLAGERNHVPKVFCQSMSVLSGGLDGSPDFERLLIPLAWAAICARPLCPAEAAH